MPQAIGVYDGGSTIITNRNGHPITVGKVIFRMSENESKPVDHIAYCKLCYKDSIVKSLKRLVWEENNMKKSTVTMDQAIEILQP